MSRGHAIPVERLERARALRGWSVTELAHRSGLGIATVSRALAGRRVAMETMRRLGAAFMEHPPLPEVRALLDSDGGGEMTASSAPPVGKIGELAQRGGRRSWL